MPVVTRTASVADVAAVCAARSRFVEEVALDPAGPGAPGSDGEVVFEARPGVVRDYRRTVEVAGSTVTQTVSYRVAVPLLGWLVALPVRAELSRIAPDRVPWWGPPDVLETAAWASLAALVTLGMVVGYLGTLLTQTITYAGREFHIGTGGQGVALAVARADILVTLGLVAVADRRGRRIVALVSCALGCVVTAVAAASPSIAWLAGLQVVAKGFVTATTITATVLLAESMPKGARAWALGVLAMASAIGAGACVVALPITGIGTHAWRLLFLGALAWLALLLPISRRLPESTRFERRTRIGQATEPARSVWSRRLALLAVANFCFQAFITPASQFQNQYLRTERFFGPGRISLFTVLTVVPGAIGIVIGGRLADTHGRRRVAVGAVVGAVVGVVLAYGARGWAMWVGSTIANLFGAATIPALNVYGPELFRTDQRGTANGLLTGAGRVGSVIGLLAVGGLSQWLGRFGPAFAIVSIGPIAVIVLVVVGFPETARRSLEELNPDDSDLVQNDPGPTTA